LGIVATALEAPAVVSGFDDIAVMGEAIEQSGRHLGVGEDARPANATHYLVSMSE
jgi:hypothetical protein